MRITYRLSINGILIILLQLQTGCNKLVQVSPPINSIDAVKTFSTDETAEAAVVAIYNQMRIGVNLFDAGATAYTGQSADELNYVYGSNEFISNTLTRDNATVGSIFWTPVYYYIFMANAVSEGLTVSTGVSGKAKGQLTGEAKFLRAFCYFYLTNLFGDVPLMLSSDFNKTALLPRSSIEQVYQQIKRDLIDAKSLLISDYSFSANNERIRANKWAATALLARIYLYQKQWDSAATQASAVINAGLYSLDSLNGAFLMNNEEAILQLQTANASPWATAEAGFFVRPTRTSSPLYYLDSHLVNAFEYGDKRRAAWTDSTIFGGRVYYYPYKYKVRVATPVGNITEYYTLLRLAEQYLIRAEAEAELGNSAAAIDDLNTIRTRAGLPNLAANLSQDQILSAVMQERRIELFAELGHRWFDLKRIGQAVSVLSQIPIKNGHVTESQLLYPIPVNELLLDPNLTQNPGYN